MARSPRLVVPGQPLHIIHRGNNRHAVFFGEDDYHRFLSDLTQAAGKYRCAVHAYVLMTNHIHLLVTPGEGGSVSGMMQAIGRRYVRYINAVYRRSGTLWEGRFKSGMIDSDRYLLTCYRYIEMNPVRAGLTDSPAGYRWSSFHHNALGHPDRVVIPHEEYLALGEENEERRRAYVALFDHEVNGREITAIREGTEKGEAIGSEHFQEEMASRIQRRVTRLGYGGDRKSKAYRGVE